MKTLRTLALAALATTFLLPAQEGNKPVATDAAAKPAPANPPLVGVVDFVKAIEQYPKYIRLKGELETRGKAAKAQIDELTKRIDEQRAALAVVSKESEEYKDRELELEFLQTQRQALFKRFNEKLEVEDMRVLTVVYEDLEAAIKKVATTRGVSIVLRVHEMDDAPGDISKLPPKTLEGRLRMLERRQVWYAADNVDLTGDVIKLLMVPLDPPKDAAKNGDAKAAEPQKPVTPKTGG